MTIAPLTGLVLVFVTAWALSLDRRAVRLRPLAFGVAFQVLLSFAVLRDDGWSHAGLLVIGFWLALFLLRPHEEGAGAIARRAALIAPVLGVATLALFALPSAALAGLCSIELGSLVLLSRFRRLPVLRPWLGSLLPLTATAWAAKLGVSGLDLLEIAGARVASFLDIADYGSRFLFGNLADDAYFFPASDAWPGFGYLFAFKLLPVIVFFAAFVSVLYYLGVVQATITGLASFMRWSLGTSGAETLCASTNIFIGQTEAPLFIKPYLPGATRSELMSVMVGGFATIAGGALAGYIALGIPAAHLIAASVLSAPAALVVAKVILPERDLPATASDVELPPIDVGSNVIEAAANGIQDGLRLAVNVGAMLIGFIALMAVVDSLLALGDRWIDGYLLAGSYLEYDAVGFSPIAGEYRGYFPGSLRTLFGVGLRPVAWAVGVPWREAAVVGNLLGIKLSLNEFVAFGTLAELIRTGALSERSVALAAYALCGFANISSIGMQIGGLSALAPDRRSDFARFGVRAMLGGALASLMTAAIAALSL